MLKISEQDKKEIKDAIRQAQGVITHLKRMLDLLTRLEGGKTK